jgi:hypothetical protein
MSDVKNTFVLQFFLLKFRNGSVDIAKLGIRKIQNDAQTTI